MEGEPSFGSLPSLEQFAGERFETYVARARRIEGELWEVELAAL